MSNAEEFLSLFNEIEKILKKRAGMDSKQGFMAAVRELSRNRKDPLVASKKDTLEMMGELRNIVVHELNGYYITEPHSNVIKALQEIKESLLKPKLAGNIMIKPVISATSTDKLSMVLRKMSTGNLTNIPVIDGENILGVLSEQSIVKWLASESENDGIMLVASSVNDILKFLDPIDGSDLNEYHFVGISEEAYAINELFINSLKSKKRLSAVFVTQNGRPGEGILGIITAWDLAGE